MPVIDEFDITDGIFEITCIDYHLIFDWSIYPLGLLGDTICTMHKQPCYKDAPAYVNGVSEAIFKVGMCLPAGPYMLTSNLSERGLGNKYLFMAIHL